MPRLLPEHLRSGWMASLGGPECGAGATTIGGFSANEKPGCTGYADTCQISVSTDPQPPVPVKNRDLHTPERKINVIEVRVDGGGCDNARATAEELVRRYNQLPG
ncbi:hypothetical protein ACIBG0_28760 [Nocardia sp. NPDC050630]|uniref:hypothetical protein n=1 Tax=Nocardia sp. NPDC050630 TaxID=3364321 RepID=UPI0037B7FD11